MADNRAKYGFNSAEYALLIDLLSISICYIRNYQQGNKIFIISVTGLPIYRRLCEFEVAAN